MKNVKITLITLLLTLVFATTGNIKANNIQSDSYLTENQSIHTVNIQSSYESSLRTDCTLKFESDDGTSLEVTFHDISIYQCAKMKIGKWIHETF